MLFITVKKKIYILYTHAVVLNSLVHHYCCTVVVNLWIVTWLYIILILLSGDVQLRPGLKDKSNSTFSICHWNLNSIKAHSYAKVLLLEAFIAAQKFDIVSISETSLTVSLHMMMIMWKLQGTI